MKLLITFALFISVAYAEVVTTVTVSKAAIVSKTGSTVTLPCSFDMYPDQDQPPIIYWMKGISVDDPDAVMIFKGYKYWNVSMGEYRQFFGDYETRATVTDLENPSLKLGSLTASDEGRYWCMVAEWSGRQQEGTDADSVALMIDSTKSYVDTYVSKNITIAEGTSSSIQCSTAGSFDTITWYEGPFHRSDSENFTHTEIGEYDKVGAYYSYNYCDGGLCGTGTRMEPTFTNFNINSAGTLTIANADVDDSGRYWCEISYHNGVNMELQTCRSSTQLTVTGTPFDCTNQAPGLYPDPEDCSMYYECVSGNPITYHRSCGYDGLVFDPDNGYCDWAANVVPPCGTNIA